MTAISLLSYFNVSQYNNDKTPLEFDYSDLPRPYYCIAYLLSGNGIFSFDGESIELSKGEIIFLPAGSRYHVKWQRPDSVHFITMHFYFASSTPFPKEKHLSIQKISPKFEGEFFEAFNQALNSFNKNQEGLLNSLGCFYKLLSKILPRLEYGDKRKSDVRMEQIAEFINNNCSEKITVDSLAEMCYMSTSHFHSCFKKAYGMTPIEYKNRICIDRAILYILQKNESIEQISERFGFESSTYFRRVFKKFTGCTPTEYFNKYVEI